ncbi:MAG: hypothetical protein V1792_23165 [Pseudomonadota bacterium]
MKKAPYIVLIVAAALVGAVYFGGTIDVCGKAPLEHLDQALGTDFFMGCYVSLASLLSRKESTEQDEWTEGPQNWDKVLKKTVE